MNNSIFWIFQLNFAILKPNFDENLPEFRQNVQKIIKFLENLIKFQKNAAFSGNFEGKNWKIVKLFNIRIE